MGLAANKKRGQEPLRGLERKGESPERLDTVHVPAGLNIRADSREEIALSIMAEIVYPKGRKAAG
jgi:xanthine dehydrogenase accessory factor